MKLYTSREITLFTFLATIFILLSCTKESSKEKKNSSPFAQGSLKDSSGDCLHVDATGSFYKEVRPGADTDFVRLKINITHAGTYKISTDLENGFYFADSGYFSRKGDTTIHLKPVGMPLHAGPTFFTVNFNTDTCYFYVDVQ